MTNLFRILHIYFASMLIALMPVAMIVLGRAKKAKGTPAELTLLATMGLIGQTISMIGSIGILITGGALVGIESYKWFSFSEFPWLAWKQTIFVVILLINFAIVMPTAKKLRKLLMEKIAAGGSGGATDEIRALAAKVGMFAPMMNILGIIAMVLGTSKGVF